MFKHSRARRFIGVAAVLVGLILVAVPPAEAQSPSPNVAFLDWRPGNLHYTTTGVVVEGLGMLACSYSLNSVESNTVASIDHGRPTVTEISPQQACGSLSSYETAFSDIISYVQSHATNWSQLWGGIMLDEEPAYDSYTNYLDMNAYLGAKMSTIPGSPWWYNEIGPCGNGVCYSQSQYDALLNGCSGSNCYISWQASQVYNSNFASLANGAGNNYVVVTWWAGASYPWNSAAYAAGAIYGIPDNQSFGISNSWYWENEFQGQ